MHLLSFKVVLEKQMLFDVYIDVYDVHKLANDQYVVMCCVCYFCYKMVVIIYLFIWYVIIK